MEYVWLLHDGQQCDSGGGKPKNAMYAMMLPSISNLILDYVLIYVFDFGMHGAAWATTCPMVFVPLHSFLLQFKLVRSYTQYQ